MQALWAKIATQLFIALGDYLFSQSSEFFHSWQDYKAALKKASDYEKKIDDPKSSIDDKLNANDEFGS